MGGVVIDRRTDYLARLCYCTAAAIAQLEFWLKSLPPVDQNTVWDISTQLIQMYYLERKLIKIKISTLTSLQMHTLLALGLFHTIKNVRQSVTQLLTLLRSML